MLKLAPWILIIFAVGTAAAAMMFAGTITTDGTFSKIFGIWMLIQMPGLITLLIASDKADAMKNEPEYQR